MSCTEPVTNDAAGNPLSTKSEILETGAAMTQVTPLKAPQRLQGYIFHRDSLTFILIGQTFRPVNNICAHLNAFHVYASDPHRCVEANHYCSHINEDVRQCLIYDTPAKNARLIGVEYMITPKLYATLDAEERQLWHSHVFEVKSGMLIMPNANIPSAAWEVAETKEMEDVIGLYGKTYHFWQVDKGDKLPLGKPELMMSYTEESQLAFEDIVGDRDKRFGVSYEQKKGKREYIAVPETHEDADSLWKS